MESYNKQKWEDLNLSRDELKSIGEALQKEEFRSLLLDYVKEINDPENRKQYESEITQLENERGVDIKFIHPSAGYVIKTIVDGKKKAFINVCTNENVGKPTSTRDVSGRTQGLHWSIPYCLAPPREDLDKKNNLCMVFDVVFHPETLTLSKSNEAFKKLVDSTALEGVEDNFKVSLDKINLKFPKVQFKGAKQASVIRKKIKEFTSLDTLDLPNYPYPPLKEVDETNLGPKYIDHKRKCDSNIPVREIKEQYTTPKYTIKHRNSIDFQNFTNDRLSRLSVTVPDELIVIIDLPLLKHSTDASIDVSNNSLFLVSESPAKYKLNLPLPYTVDSNKGNAKFDVAQKTLTVTLIVLKSKSFSNEIELAREDSGVESDNYNVRSSSMSSSDDDGYGKSLDENIEFSKKERHRPSQGKNESGPQIAKMLLKSNVQYILPNFTCQLLLDTLQFTLQSSNVNPDSVKYYFLNENSGFHLTFQSIGAGFYPVNYAMYLLLQPGIQVENESLSIEVWDNNVILQTKLINGLQISEYYVGTDRNNLKSYTISDQESEVSLKEKNKENKCSLSLESIANSDINDSLISGTLSESPKPTDEDDTETTETNFIDSKSENKPKTVKEKFVEERKDSYASESVSSFDESSSPTNQQHSKSRTVSESNQADTTNKSRGILKIGRSLSESCVDDYITWSAEKVEKSKKTVRFSEVISKQVFRMNSSILGQRKKNQRKTRNKKRAQERRLSESGGESEGENEILSKTVDTADMRGDVNIWLLDPDSSSCDVSEVSDISESDDGQKEEKTVGMPCSSKRNHKRRGKKSARKNAATAKLQYMFNQI